MRLRRVHRIIGLCFSPFFIITVITGICLLWRKAGVYGKGTKDLFIGVHNWEIVTSYVGVILAMGLLFMAISGIIMAFKRSGGR